MLSDHRLIHSEFKRLTFSDVVSEFSTMEGRVLEMAESSKAKDFKRGLHINAVFIVWICYVGL